MQHLVLEYYQLCSNDYPRLTLTYVRARSNLVPYAFVWEKGKTIDFSETFVVCDIKVGPRSLRFNIFKILFLRNRWASWSQFHVEPTWDVGMKICSNGPGHMTKMVAMPIYGKTLKKWSLKPKGQRPWNLVCSIKYSNTTRFVQMMTLGWPWPI